MTRAEKLANSHWEYVRGVLAVHGVDWDTIYLVGHHYTTSFVHAYGHGREDERNGVDEVLTEDNSCDMVVRVETE